MASAADKDPFYLRYVAHGVSRYIFDTTSLLILYPCLLQILVRDSLFEVCRGLVSSNLEGSCQL